MSLKIGIVGLPNVGKSTLFKALTRKQVEIANYPFATIDPNVGVVHVPDERIERLALLSNSKKTIPAAVEFVDIAGLVKGAAEGQGLGNKFLTHIKEVDAIAEVVRVFEDKEIIRVDEAANPLSDIEVIEYELILKDLETLSKRLETAERDIRGNKAGAKEEADILRRFKEGLEKGRTIIKILEANFSLLELECIQKIIGELQPLTAKPVIYVFNASEKQIQNGWQPEENLKKRIGDDPYTVVCAKIESELADLSQEERKEFMRSLGIQESGLDQLIKTGYRTLGLITFFTTGEDETRAWTIPQGSAAPRAGRAIHSDFEEKFIRAEVINWQKLLEIGSWAGAREKGLLRTEGREYIVQDGDVIEFRI